MDKEIQPVFRNLAYYACAVCLVISTNTVYGSLNSNRNVAALIIFCIAVLFVFVWLAVKGLHKAFIGPWLLWCVLLAAVFFIIGLASGMYGGWNIRLFFCVLAILPAFLYVLDNIGDTDRFYRAFINVMTILAIISIFLWIIGPMLEFIQPNCQIESTWNGLGTLQIDQGYYGLLYLTQHQDLGNITFWRNTGIFNESPMVSYALCVALSLECLISKLPIRKFVVVVLSVAVITSTSTTGLIFLIGLFTSFYIRSISTAGKDKLLRIVFFVLVGILALVCALQLFGAKMDTGSGTNRADDFVSGFKAWMDSPFVGNGFGNSDAYKEYMSDFRMSNQGFSNSPMQILAFGGVLFLAPYIIAFSGYFVKVDLNRRLAGVLLVFVFIVTIITSLPLTALILSIGLKPYLGGGLDYKPLSGVPKLLLRRSS